MRTEYGQVIYQASVSVTMANPMECENVYDTMEEALSDLGDIEVLDFEMDDWDEEHECEAVMRIRICEHSKRRSWEAVWGNRGGVPGESVYSTNFDESIIEEILKKHSLSGSVSIHHSYFEAA